MSTKLDENYVKPSNHKQWQERSDIPVIHNKMTKEKIEEHKANLVASYGCDPSDIKYDFERITDRDDEDRDECILIVYKMDTIRFGKKTTVVIFSQKCLIPEHLKKKAEQMKREQMEKQKSNVKLICGPDESQVDIENDTNSITTVPTATQISPNTTVPTATVISPTKATRPKIRKPAQPKK